MSYYQTDLVIAGAVDESEAFDTEPELEAYVAQLDLVASAHTEPMALYVLHHDHEPTECECIQFEQDLRPAHEWNTGNNREQTT